MSACLLWTRAGVVGVLAFMLGVVGHVGADGLLPGPGMLALLLALSVGFSVPMLAQRAGPVRLMALTVGGQAGTHLFLTLSAGHVGDPGRAPATHPMVGTSSSLELPVVDGHRVGSMLDAYRAMSDAPTAVTPMLPIGHLVGEVSAHASMMAVHLAASALVGLWLALGERCLWELVALLKRRLLVVLTVLRVQVTIAPRLSRVVDRVPVSHRTLWFESPNSRRGPPLPGVSLS